MATYTLVDEGYDVTVLRSIKQVFSWVSEDCRYLDADGEIPLTMDRLAAELRKTGEARIFEEGARDWTVKIKRHDS